MIRATSILLAAGLLLAAPSSDAAPPVVGNLVASQREGTKLVDITYDLEVPDAATATVTLRISSDGGDTWTVPTTSATGDVGAGVEPGTDKAIVWNAGIDWPGRYSEQMRFRVVADDGIPDPAPDGFSLIPAGTFMMGRTSDDEDHYMAPPATPTTISKHYYMEKTEATKGQWDAVRTWGSTNGYTDLPEGGGKASDHPVQNIDWWAAVKWCNARSEMELLTPCYYMGDGAVFKTGVAGLQVDMQANGYRLPTSAEWERAARGDDDGYNGDTKRFPWGDVISHNEANFQNTGGEAYQTGTTGHHGTYATGGMPYTSPVGSFAANDYELHDMVGNVAEWCWVNGFSVHQPYRGGGWAGPAEQCRVGFSPIGERTLVFNFIGFRVVRSTLSPTP